MIIADREKVKRSDGRVIDKTRSRIPDEGPRNSKVHKLRSTGIEHLERISDRNLLGPGLVYLHLFLWSEKTRKCREHFVRGSNLPILPVCGHSTEPLKDPHSGLYPPKDCMFVVKEWCRSKGEEELGTCGFLDGCAEMVRGPIPLVSGPELAIAKIPAPVNRSSE